jgi:hypothetical protein
MLIPSCYWLRLYSWLRVVGTLFGLAKQLDNIGQGSSVCSPLNVLSNVESR